MLSKVSLTKKYHNIFFFTNIQYENSHITMIIWELLQIVYLLGIFL